MKPHICDHRMGVLNMNGAWDLCGILHIPPLTFRIPSAMIGSKRFRFHRHGPWFPIMRKPQVLIQVLFPFVHPEFHGKVW